MTCYELPIDRKYREAMETSSDKLLNAMKDARAGRAGSAGKFKWGVSINSGAYVPAGGAHRATALQRIAAIHASDILADSLRVSRDACPNCGVRGDIGCGHQ